MPSAPPFLGANFRDQYIPAWLWTSLDSGILLLPNLTELGVPFSPGLCRTRRLFSGEDWWTYPPVAAFLVPNLAETVTPFAAELCLMPPTVALF